MRRLKRWICRLISDWKSRPYVATLKADIEKALGHSVVLKQGGSRGRDSIFEVLHNGEAVGMARLAHRKRANNDIDEDKPYRRIAPEQRIAYEWSCCEKGAPENLTPKPLWHGESGIMVSRHPGTSFDNYFFDNPEKFWDYVMRTNMALHKWHQMGMSHMDASLSNVVGDFDLKDAWLIDFEYQPAPNLTFGQQKAYDFLRLVESSYKFVPEGVLADCEAWKEQMIDLLDEETRNADLTPVRPGVERIYKNQELLAAIEQIFREVA